MVSFFELVEQKYDEFYLSGIYYYSPEEEYRQAYIQACLALMNTEFNPNERELEDGETILMTVTSTGRLDLVKFLVEAGADVNALDYDGKSFALNEAARLGWVKIYEYLAPLTVSSLRQIAENSLSKGIIYRQLQNELLAESFVKSAWHGEINKLKTALENSVNIDVIIKMPGSSGECALHRACRYGRTSIVSFLLEVGANPNIQEKDSGETSLIKAVKAGNVEIVRILLTASANIYIQNCLGKNALYYAQKAGNNEIIQLLLRERFFSGEMVIRDDIE